MNAKLQAIQIKIKDLNKKIMQHEDDLAKARLKLTQDPTDENAQIFRRCAESLENTRLAFDAARELEKQAAVQVTGENAKKDQKRMADLESQAGSRKAEILKAVKKLNEYFTDLDVLQGEHRKLAARYGQIGNEYKGDYKHIERLHRVISEWERGWDRYQRSKEPMAPLAKRELTQLQKDVTAMRYRDPTQREVNVILLERDDGTAPPVYRVSK